MQAKDDREWTRAVRALDELRAFWRSAAGEKFGRVWMDVYRDRYGHQKPQNPAACEPSVLGRAALYWVDADMSTLCHHAARTMPDSPLLEDEIPSPFGFALFSEPIVVAGYHAEARIPVDACSWHVLEGAGVKGVRVGFYSSAMPHDVVGASLGFLSWHSRRLGTTLEEMLQESRSMNRIPDEVSEEHLLCSRLPVAFWRISQQVIARTTEMRTPRCWRRRGERDGQPIDTVRVVTLRRQRGEADSAGDAHDVEWSHRWLVSGHWRNQWLPSKQGHRLQWIHGYVKGPAEAPLVIKKTVHALVR